MAKKQIRRRRHDFMVLKLVALVAVVLVIFEGRLVVTMISHSSSRSAPTVTDSSVKSDSRISVDDSGSSSGGSGSPAVVHTISKESLAGLTGFDTSEAAKGAGQTEKSGPLENAVVGKADVPVDDSYFSDAVFIGDSRMEGFRNSSGITQGQFFTSVGMSLSGLTSGSIIQYGDETITVADAVSRGKYKKIYLMLGTNDLGEYDLEGFHDSFTSAAARLLELQPGAILYICSIIYVEEDKAIPISGEYVNNTNVDKLNKILLQICEEQGYHYIDLNEILSDGNGSLIAGASSDGVHVYPDYCKKMLDYLKTHYIPVDNAETSSEAESETSTETPGGAAGV